MKDALTHYGVLGMKWGVRRTPEQLKRQQGTKQRAQKQKSSSSRKHDYGALLNSLRIISGMTLTSQAVARVAKRGKIDAISVMQVIGGSSLTFLGTKNLTNRS